MTQDLFDQELSDRKEWNRKFITSPDIRKMNFYGTNDYYVRMLGTRVLEIYSIDENECLRREPLSTIMMHPACVPMADGYRFFNETYTQEEFLKDEREVILFENS